MSGREISDEEQAEGVDQAQEDPLHQGVQRDPGEGLQVQKTTDWKYEQENIIIVINSNLKHFLWNQVDQRYIQKATFFTAQAGFPRIEGWLGLLLLLSNIMIIS